MTRRIRTTRQAHRLRRKAHLELAIRHNDLVAWNIAAAEHYLEENTPEGTGEALQCIKRGTQHMADARRHLDQS